MLDTLYYSCHHNTRLQNLDVVFGSQSVRLPDTKEHASAVSPDRLMQSIETYVVNAALTQSMDKDLRSILQVLA
jgi:hypothetical protein